VNSEIKEVALRSGIFRPSSFEEIRASYNEITGKASGLRLRSDQVGLLGWEDTTE
jgi:hypothetical protein